VLVFAITGCAHLPTEKGVWNGHTESKNVYKADGTPVPALCLVIGPGQIKNQFILNEVILVDKKLRIIPPEGRVGKIVKIKGRIFLGSPINPVNQKELRSVLTVTTNDDVVFSYLVQVMKVNPKKLSR